MAALVAAHPHNAIWRRGLAISRQRLGEALMAAGDSAGAAEQFHACLAVDVPAEVWAPRDLWPRDVAAYCRRALEAAP
jgi:hypothetical protein